MLHAVLLTASALQPSTQPLGRRSAVLQGAAAAVFGTAVNPALAFNLPPLEEFEDPQARRYYANLPNPDMSGMQSKAFYAVATGDNGSFKAMVDAGWPVEKIKDTAGKTVLHVAAQKGNTQAVTLMLSTGMSADPIDTWKQTPLHFAARNGKMDCVKALVDAGASKTALTYGGDTAEELARKYKKADIADLLAK